jgi:hypothetical protein
MTVRDYFAARLDEPGAQSRMKMGFLRRLYWPGWLVVTIRTPLYPPSFGHEPSQTRGETDSIFRGDNMSGAHGRGLGSCVCGGYQIPAL